MKIGSGIDIRVQDITVKDELLLRPIDETHVAKLAIAYKWNPSAAPHIIVQKVMNANFVRVHCHSFKALRRAGEERIRCRYIEGEEWEIRSYGLQEQSQIKDFTPQQYHDNIIIIRDALIEKNGKCSIRDLEEHTHLKKSQIHKLIQGFSDDDIKELMKEGTSFTKAYETVHLADKPKVEEKEKELTKPDGHTLGDDSGPILDLTPGDDGDSGLPKEEISPEGEGAGSTSVPPSPTKPGEGSDSSGGSLPGEEGGSTEPETPPPEPKSDGWKQGWYCKNCGCFIENGTDGIIKKRNTHTCKDAVVITRRIQNMMKDLIETRELIGGENTKLSGFLIKKIYNPYELSDERLKELQSNAHEIKRVAPSVKEAVENLIEFNGRMKVS